MKNILSSILLVLVGTIVFAQTNCDEVQTKNKKINAELTKIKAENNTLSEKITSLNKELTYLKEALDLLNVKDKKESENIIYRINSVKGNSDNGTITIEGLIENQGVVKRFQTSHLDFTDPKGVQYKTYKVKFGQETWIEKFQRNLPTKFVVVFDKIIDEPTAIKAFVFNTYGRQPVIFKNLPIIWE